MRQIRPVPRGRQPAQGLVQGGAHLPDAVAHAVQFVLPQLAQARLVEDAGHHTQRRGRRIHARPRLHGAG
ncbi:hypothetical protein G6F65_023492 [Rhizopus arrhizus]|nr:hypothetical protein G6F68_020075 [Rhizopus microsporus]KAG1241275.1 hypothetical protein G6F65_023492 [Rhizopus arrhizus]